MRTRFLGAASALLLLSAPALAADPSDTPSAATRAAPKSSAGPATVERTSAEHLIGKSVIGANNETLGKVKDVIIDPKSGRAKQLVLASGGFLGIGEKQVAVDYNDAEVRGDTSKIMIPDLSRQQVQAMRDFDYDDTMVSLNRSTDMDKTSIDSSTLAK
jgi:sporulation protein YlmC with PRC-barrel domain